MPDDAKLVEVKIKPYYGNFMILCTIETESVSVTEDRPFMAGIDFGVDNKHCSYRNKRGLCPFVPGRCIKVCQPALQ